MLFNTLTVLGAAAVALAAPTLEKKEVETREAFKLPERGISWTPARSVEKRNRFGNSWNNFGQTQVVANVQVTNINVLQVDANPLLAAQLAEETIFAQTIQDALISAQFQLNTAIDNIRINTLNQLNTNVNTVAVIVTEINDNRGGNSNKRYLTRHIQSNSNIRENVFVVIQETPTLTINNNIPSQVLQNAEASGTGFSQPTFGSYTPGGQLSLQSILNSQSAFNLLPSGSAFPQFSNAQQITDPALIILPGQSLFVQSSQDNSLFSALIQQELAQILSSGGSFV